MSDIYQHFRKDEEPFIDQALEWKRIVAEQYWMKLTDFLDPREQVILQSVIGQSDEVRLEFFGGSLRLNESGLCCSPNMPSRLPKIFSFKPGKSSTRKNLPPSSIASFSAH